MTGKQAAVVLFGIASLFAADYAFNAWLENQRVTKVDELRSQEHLNALKSFSLANEEQGKRFAEVIEVVKSQGEIGKRAEQMRKLADDMKDEKSKQMMLRIADDCEGGSSRSLSERLGR